MKIEHIAMYVRDLEAEKNFFVGFFGAVSNDGYHNPKTGLRTYFLTFSDGARLELMNRPDMISSAQDTISPEQDAISAEKASVRTGYIHLAFSAGSRQKVDEITEHLREAGCQVLSGPRMTGDGYYESCVLDPENNQIEITV